MEVTNELIARFFRQECTPEELSFISDYFEQHPDELEKYLGEDDWQNFEADAQLHPAVSQQMLQNIEGNIEVRPRVGKTRIKTYIAAASVILIAGATWFISSQIYKNNQQKQTDQSVIAASVQVNDTVINKTGKELAIDLPDGSVITLSAKSGVSYNKAFNQKHRDIYLSGEAVFKVAKDKTRPFTVYASGLSTTALGTCFRVTAFNNDSHVSVKLYEGKVVIKHTLPVNDDAGNDVYLTPGYELQWNSSVKTGRVTAFNNTVQPPIQSAIATTESKAVKGIVKFNNERLAAVLNQLQQMYNIRIKIAAGSPNNKFFTGTVDSRTETADDILRTIATLNKFNLKKQGDAYILSAEINASADSAARLKRNE